MKMQNKAILVIVIVAAIAAFTLSPTLFAIVLPGNHMGSIVAGVTAEIGVDALLYGNSTSLAGAKIWVFIKDLDETTTFHSTSQDLSLTPGQTKTYTFNIPATVTAQWMPGEYKLLIEGRAADGSLLPLDGSIGDPEEVDEGGVAWQFTVLPAGSPIPGPQPKPGEGGEMPDWFWGLTDCCVRCNGYIHHRWVYHHWNKKKEVKMKKLTVAVISVFLIAIAAYFFITSPTVRYTWTGECQTRFLVPILGRIACEPVDGVGVQSISTDVVSGSTKTVVCGDNENSDKCEIKAKCGPYTFAVSEKIYYRVNAEETWHLGCSDKPADYECLLKTINAGDKIEVWCKGGVPEYGPGTIIEYFEPYKLYRHDGGGRFEVWHETGFYSCDLQYLSQEVKSQLCYEGFAESIDGPKIHCEDIASTLVPFGTWKNYVAHWSDGPYDLNVNEYAYGGQTVFCSAGVLYSIGEITLSDMCYNYPETYIATVSCCPGDMSENAYCGDTFEWIPINVGDCVTDADCPIGYSCIDADCIYQEMTCISDLECMGGGKFSCNYDDVPLTATRWGCLNGVCQQAETIPVECCPPAVNCPTGQLCNAETFQCEGGTGGKMECGDGVCSRPFENEISCPTDCGTLMDNTHLMTYLVIALITIIMAILVGKLSGFGPVGYFLGGCLGLIVSLILWYFLNLPVWVYWLIGLVGIGGLYIFIAIGGLAAVLTALVLGRSKKR
jgi:hypothetical protein